MTDAEKIKAARPGDWFKGKLSGHPFEGEVWSDDTMDDARLVGSTAIRYWDGGINPDVTDVEVIPAAWPEGTVIAYRLPCVGRERVGIVGSQGKVSTLDGWYRQEQLREYTPTVLRLGSGE